MGLGKAGSAPCGQGGGETAAPHHSHRHRNAQEPALGSTSSPSHKADF